LAPPTGGAGPSRKRARSRVSPAVLEWRSELDREQPIVSNGSGPPDLRVYVLDTGLILCDDYAIFSPSVPPNTRRDMSVRSYLIVHPRGTLLWDTGIDDAVAALPAGKPIVESIVFKVPRTLRAQLAEIEISPADVGYVGLSHLHVDHVGNLDLFPDATVLLQQAERDAGFGPNPEAYTLSPDTYAALDPRNIETVEGTHDVFGDDSVVLIPLPGHTPGHQGLLVRLPAGGPILLAGDIAYDAGDYARGAVRRANVDLEQSRTTIETAKRIERAERAAVWLHHDLVAQAGIRLSPASYR
jgi:N-acyl homoserine lactone hydrolase